MRTVPHLLSLATSATILLSGCASSPKQPDPVASYRLSSSTPEPISHGCPRKSAIARLESLPSPTSPGKTTRNPNPARLRPRSPPRRFPQDCLRLPRHPAILPRQPSPTPSSSGPVHRRRPARITTILPLDHGRPLQETSIAATTVRTHRHDAHSLANKDGQVILHQDYWDATPRPL